MIKKRVKKEERREAYIKIYTSMIFFNIYYVFKFKKSNVPILMELAGTESS